MVALSVNQIVATAVKIVNEFTNCMVEARQEELLAGEVEEADLALAHIYELQDDFRKKIDRLGAERPQKYFDGHEFSIRNQCLGDGHDPNDCSRWFVKVGAFFDTILATDIDLE
jgi:hypothetical protein